MSRTIELPDEVYVRIEKAAAETGRSVAEMISVLFPPEPAEPAQNGGKPRRRNPDGSRDCATENAPRTMADVLAPYLGTVASGGLDAIAGRQGDAFSDYLLEKKRNGTL